MISVIEVMISALLLSICLVTVDASVSIMVTHQTQVTQRTEALDALQTAQEAITHDVHAATDTWTTPALPTSLPSQPVTATTLAFTASLGGGTPTINIGLNTSTHVLTVTCTGVGCHTGATSTSVFTQAQISNVDSASLFTLTTKEVTTVNGSVTANSFFYTTVGSSLIVDTPSVRAANIFHTTLADPNIVTNNAEYGCQAALSGIGATGSC